MKQKNYPNEKVASLVVGVLLLTTSCIKVNAIFLALSQNYDKNKIECFATDFKGALGNFSLIP